MTHCSGVDDPPDSTRSWKALTHRSSCPSRACIGRRGVDGLLMGDGKMRIAEDDTDPNLESEAAHEEPEA